MFWAWVIQVTTYLSIWNILNIKQATHFSKGFNITNLFILYINLPFIYHFHMFIFCSLKYFSVQ